MGTVAARAEQPDVTVGDMQNVVPTLPDGAINAPIPTAPVDAMVDLPLAPVSGAAGHDMLGAASDHGSDIATHTSAGGGGLPQFDATWFPSQLFWLAVTFFLMYRFFARVALPRIADTIASRAAQVSGDIQSAENLADQAKSVRIAYERDMNRAKEKAGDAVRDVDQKIKLKMADLLYAYRTKMTMETTRAMDDLGREKERLLDDMRHIAADITARTTSDILGVSVDADTAARAVQVLDTTRRAA
jgi:F-type H+-transporting ATPase subunit b